MKCVPAPPAVEGPRPPPIPPIIPATASHVQGTIVELAHHLGVCRSKPGQLADASLDKCVCGGGWRKVRGSRGAEGREAVTSQKGCKAHEEARVM